MVSLTLNFQTHLGKKKHLNLLPQLKNMPLTTSCLNNLWPQKLFKKKYLTVNARHFTLANEREHL